MRFSVAVCLIGAVAAEPTFEYVVDCAMAKYDYSDAARGLNATYSAQSRSACVSACQTACVSSDSAPLGTTDCLKNDGMAGCSYFVKQTMTGQAHMSCPDSPVSSKLVLRIDPSYSFKTKPMPVAYTVSIPEYAGLTVKGAYRSGEADADMCKYEFTADIPVPCDESGNCDITDVAMKNPDLPYPAVGPAPPIFSILLAADDGTKNVQKTDPRTTKYMSAGFTPAIATTCTAKTTCNDCAAAKCNWCDNTASDAPATVTGYKGCGVTFDECQMIGSAFDNCDAYPKSGGLKATGFVSFAALTVAAVATLTL